MFVKYQHINCYEFVIFRSLFLDHWLPRTHWWKFDNVYGRYNHLSQVDTLKILTKKKRELEDALQNKVAGIGVGQELDENFKDIPCPACGDPECDHKEDHL